MLKKVRLDFLLVLIIFNWLLLCISTESKFSNYQKRAGVLDFDLNLPAPEEHSTDQEPSKSEESKGIEKSSRKRRRYKDALTKEEGRKKALERQKKYERRIRQEIKEAKQDPSKMTPKIESYIVKEKHKKRRYFQSLHKKVENGTATEKQKNLYHSQRGTKVWRASNPQNEVKYQIRLQKTRERRHRKKLETPSKSNSQQDLPIETQASLKRR